MLLLGLGALTIVACLTLFRCRRETQPKPILAEPEEDEEEGEEGK